MKNLKAEEQHLFEFQSTVIKGYPELKWTGKRPYTATQFYPAQLKERYGIHDENGWINKIFWGDNLQVMSHLLKEFRNKVDLIYIDPPFDSKADYKKKIELKGKKIYAENSVFEEKQYSDIWTNDEYLQFMYERLILLKELLSDTGSIYLHCDYHKSHHLRSLMDEVFGHSNFRNEIVWHYKTYQGQVSAYFPRKHDTILLYSKSSKYFFKLLKDSDPEKTIDFTRWNSYLNENNEITGANYPEQDSRFMAYYKRFVKENHRNPGHSDVILKIEGNTIDSVWEIKAIDPKNTIERLGYPTQKPEKLIERIIDASSKEGDLVFDCFMGSGTTQAVSLKKKRRFIGADINLGAIQTTSRRLINFLNNEIKTVGFEVYNVNNYDFFRNPIEAKELLIEALNIQKFNSTNIFDGELDGRNVKIMPVNRITTKADLGELVANLPYQAYEKIY
ncbi:site-specific DNA-methyltransferase, partial [Mycoplasmopsis agassizii]